MLDLKSPRWSTLSHAYGPASNIPKLLLQLNSLPKILNYETEPYFTLWSSLCHQGDAYTASFAAVPHILSICEIGIGRSHWSLPQLAVSIEIARLAKRSPVIPNDLEHSYLNAIAKLPSLIVRMNAENPSEEIVAVGAAALAVSNGLGVMAEAYMEMTPNVAPKFLNWVFEH